MARSALPHIFSVLGITRRTHPQGSGNFTYTNPGSKSLRTFVWDDAGIDERGYLVLVEEELTGLVPLHVEGHIARVKVMMARGESVGRVVWVVRPWRFGATQESVWVRCPRTQDSISWIAAGIGNASFGLAIPNWILTSNRCACKLLSASVEKSRYVWCPVTLFQRFYPSLLESSFHLCLQWRLSAFRRGMGRLMLFEG